MRINYHPVVSIVASAPVIKATQFISPTHIIRVTRKLFKGRILKGNVEMIVTVGKPNYVERKFIEKCKKVGEPFPVKKIQLKHYNPKRKGIK